MARIVYESFDSLTELITTLENRQNNSVFAGKRCDSNKAGRSDFYGTDSYADAVALAKDGWADPLEQLKETAKAAGVKTNVTHDKRRPTTGIVGYAPCVPNAIRGLPNSMIMTERTPSKVKAVTLVYVPCDVADASVSSYLKAGVAVLDIIQRLELAGFRVRLQAEFKSSKEGNEEYAIVRVTLKDWRQPLDMKKLTFPLANSAMQRRLGFRWLETTPSLTNRGWSCGYGSTLHRNWDYDKQVSFYTENGLLKNNEYFITKKLCEDENFNVDNIMSRAGMKLGEVMAG